MRLKDKKRKARRRKKALGIVIAVSATIIVLLIILALFASSEELKVTHYDVSSDKITEDIKILQISDLHDCLYGENQCEIMKVLEDYNPDLVVFTGDIADKRWEDENAYLLARLVAEKYKSYYVFGNHENAYKGNVSIICKKFEECGLTVLRGDGENLIVNGNEILICGIDDPLAAPDYNLRMWENELEDCKKLIDGSKLSILLSHRPECANDYADSGFDLVFAGHAHGGQVRIPVIFTEGLYAPHQGWFPNYTGGLYKLSDQTTLIVSTGLSKQIKPRIFNRPEIVTVTVKANG